MRDHFVEGRSVGGALLCALVLVTSACAPPFASPPQKEQNVQQALASPTPSLSPAPTTPLAVSSPPFHSGEVGVHYAQVALAATGGTSPYTWAISDGALPSGLSLGNDGKLSGTPTNSGTFNFTVQATDTAGATAGLPATIAIAAALNVSLTATCLKACAAELGCVTVCGKFGNLSGGVTPYVYTRTSGLLPSGTSLSGMTLTGTFTGVPGWVLFTVMVTDRLGATVSISPTFHIFPHISLKNGACFEFFYPDGCSTNDTSNQYNVPMPYTGGIGTPTVKVVSATGQYCPPPNYACVASASPPPGFSATVSGGRVVASVAPVARPGFAYKGTVTLRLSDQSLCAAGANCSATATVAVTVELG